MLNFNKLFKSFLAIAFILSAQVASAQYEIRIPAGTAALSQTTAPPVSYVLNYTGWDSCGVDGIESRFASCINEDTNQSVSMDNCAEPVLMRDCSPDVSLVYAKWGSCDETSTQTREASCLLDGMTSVDLSYCSEPVLSQSCTPNLSLSYGEFGSCSNGVKTRSASCLLDDTKSVDLGYCSEPVTTQSCMWASLLAPSANVFTFPNHQAWIAPADGSLYMWSAPNGHIEAAPGKAKFQTLITTDSQRAYRFRFSYDDNMAIYINGQPATGTLTVGFQSYTVVDLTLPEGRNRITLVGTNGGSAPNPAGIAGSIRDLTTNQIVSVTGPSWQSTTNSGF